MNDANDPSSGADRGLLERLHRHELQLRTLARSVWRVQEDEQRRLARELHDGIGQNLAALKHRLATLATAMPDPEPMRIGLEAAMSLCSETLEEARRLSRQLRPRILDDLGLLPALRWLARSFDEQGERIEISSGDLPRLDADLETLVFRITQEAVNNAIRHSGATRIVVDCRLHGSDLRLTVVDNGRGGDPARMMDAAGGLSGLRERVRLFGGRFSVENGPGIKVAVQLSGVAAREGSP